MRLKDKVAIVVGAGQSPGTGMGNGRATVLRFAQEGAKVLAVDNNPSSAEETAAMALKSGGECTAFEADVTREATLAAMVERGQNRSMNSNIGEDAHQDDEGDGDPEFRFGEHQGYPFKDESTARSTEVLSVTLD